MKDYFQKTYAFLVIFVFLFLSACNNSDLTFIFEPNNGTAVFSVPANQLSDLPTPSLQNARFVGWFLDSELSSEFNYEIFLSGRTVSYDIRLFGKWSFDYEIVINPNNEEPQQRVIFGFENRINLEIPRNYGYEFDGWYLDKDLTAPLSLNTMPSNDLEVYAKWRIGSYNLNFYNVNRVFESVSTYVFGDVLDFPTPTREGYSFDRWVFLENRDEFQETTMPGYDVNLFPIWIPHQYRLIFDYPGVGVRTVSYDEQVTLPTPTKKYHEFLGWTIDETLIPQSYIHNASTIDASLLNNGNEIRLVPIWSEVEYSRLIYVEDRLLGQLRAQHTYFVLDNRLLMFGNAFDVRRYHQDIGTYLGYLDVTKSLNLSAGEQVAEVYADDQYVVVRTSNGNILVDSINPESCSSNLGFRAEFTSVASSSSSLNVAFTHFGVFLRGSDRNLVRVHFDCSANQIISEVWNITNINSANISQIVGDYNLIVQMNNGVIYWIEEDGAPNRFSVPFGTQTDDLFEIKTTERAILLSSIQTRNLYHVRWFSENNVSRITGTEELLNFMYFPANVRGVGLSFSKDYLASNGRSLYLINVSPSIIRPEKVIDFPLTINNIQNIQQISFYNEISNRMEPYYLIITSDERYYVMNDKGLFLNLTPPQRSIITIRADGIVITRNGLNIVGDLPVWTGSIQYGQIQIFSTNQLFTDNRPLLGTDYIFKESLSSTINVPNVISSFGRTFSVSSLFTDPLVTQRYFDNRTKERIVDLIDRNIALFAR